MSASLPLWVHLFRVVLVFGLFLVGTAMFIWGERRLVARMQARQGPNRVGPFGAMQTLVDGVKMFFKEDVTPAMVDRPLYLIAPLITVVVAFLTIAVIPIGGEVTLFGETFPLLIADLDVGVLWFVAMSSIHVYGVVLAGWASQSAYPLLGAVRSGAQLISYEIAQGLAVASVFIYAGSLRVSDIVAAQAGDGLVPGMPGWFLIPLFPAFLVFFVGMIAETQRPPFDMPESEGELVAGFHTEYSGLRFGMFMLAEFMGVLIMSAMVVTLFFGGPSGPTFGLPTAVAWVLPIVWFTLKTFMFMYVFVLLRATMPRIRYDKLMDLGWKVLIPVALVWTMVSAGLVLLREQGQDLLAGSGRWVVAGVGLLLAAAVYFVPALFTRSASPVAVVAGREAARDDRVGMPVVERQTEDAEAM